MFCQPNDHIAQISQNEGGLQVEVCSGVGIGIGIHCGEVIQNRDKRQKHRLESEDWG